MKIKSSIFTKILACFILFGVITISICVFYLLVNAMIIGNGNAANVMPQSFVDESGNIQNLDVAENLGAWVEEIDENLNVVNVYGNKKTANTTYTAEELMQYASPYSENELVVFFFEPEKSKKMFLCFFDRNIMQLQATVLVNNVDGYEDYNFEWLLILMVIMEIVLISVYLRQKIKKPLDKIVEGMENLKAGNDGARISMKTEAEFEQIIDTFNLMAEQLETEKKEKSELVRKKNQMLLELSHDIKTPVATIKSYANALESGLVPEEKKQNYYHTIDVKADRVRKLSDDMFMMLKMDNPDYNIQSEHIDLCEHLRKLCAEYYDEITEAGLEFLIDIPDEKLQACVDLSLFSRVVGNLLSNAIKYNKSGSIVGISCQKTEGRIRILVYDDGKKIEKELADQMFSPFVRGDKTRKSSGGTGLGLAIAKIIVEKHGGSLSYRHEEEKNVFEICLDGD